MVWWCVVLSGQLYAESQSQCSEYKLQNDELVRQLSSLTRRISPAEHYTNLALQPPAPENESESALERGSDREKTHKSAWMLDFTEEGDRGGGESEASLSSPSFVNIESSSTDNSSHVRRDVIEPRAQVILLTLLTCSSSRPPSQTVTEIYSHW